MFVVSHQFKGVISYLFIHKTNRAGLLFTSPQGLEVRLEFTVLLCDTFSDY